MKNLFMLAVSEAIFKQGEIHYLTWNSKTLLDPQEQFGISESFGICSRETHSGCPL